jgi:hypothetical protein
LGKYEVQIFDQFEGKDGTVMYILNDAKDSIAADYLAENNKLRFTYYPQINNNLQFEPDCQQKLIEYIKTEHPKAIKLIREMCDFINTRRERLFSQRQHDVFLAEKLLKKLEIKLVGKPYLQDDGAIIIKSSNDNGMLKMSPPNSIDFRYVYIQPKNSYDDSIRCLLDNRGDIFRYFETPDEIMDFRKGYTRAIRNYQPEQSNIRNI